MQAAGRSETTHASFERLSLSEALTTVSSVVRPAPQDRATPCFACSPNFSAAEGRTLQSSDDFDDPCGMIQATTLHQPSRMTNR